MLYPTYAVNGVPMQDAKGRWHEHPEQNFLPIHSGMRSYKLGMFGLDGQEVLNTSPLDVKNFALRIVVNAVDEKGGMADSLPERLLQLHRNVEALNLAMRIPMMTRGRKALISLRLSETESRTARGMLVADASVERKQHEDYAIVTFLFEIPAGKWRGAQHTVKVSSFTETRIEELASSTAPVQDAIVTFTGPFVWMQVTNAAGDGFELTQVVPQGQAVSVDVLNWAVSEPYAYVAEEFTPPPEGFYQYSGAISRIGQTESTALTLLPENAGAYVSCHGDGRTTDASYTYFTFREAYV